MTLTTCKHRHLTKCLPQYRRLFECKNKKKVSRLDLRKYLGSLFQRYYCSVQCPCFYQFIESLEILLICYAL